MHDCLIVGGGVVGLSLAFELARHGARVAVVDRGIPGQEASWAGAGILPPATEHPRATSHERLAARSGELHAQWALELRERTGIDNGYRRTGGIYVAQHPADVDPLDAEMRRLAQCGVRAQRLDPRSAAEAEPALAGVPAAWLLRDEAQVRNPRHVRALLAACTSLGVEISAGVEVHDIVARAGRVENVATNGGPLAAGVYCITAGAWSSALAARAGCTPSIVPVRGQMVLLAGAPRLLRHVVNDGPRYLVPRDDGRVLIGSTEEDTGFDKNTTSEAIAGLLEFGLGLVPALRAARFERCWAGLRPATADRLPYLGAIPGLTNAFIAAGHFRAGLHLSPGTAVVMSELIRGAEPSLDLAPFRIDRPGAAQRG